jgi:hypothetical protein
VGIVSGPTIRPAYSEWPYFNRQFRAVVAGLTDEQLAIQPTPERWPLWATIGHVACQRVSWLCGFAGVPGAETTPFPNALYACPGDEYLEPTMSADELVAAIDSTFAIVEACLDTWTLDSLDEEIRRNFGDEESVHSRGWIMQRVFAHDVSHCTELNETFGREGTKQIDLWR